MKKIWIVFIIVCLGYAFVACEKEHGPSIDDHFLNYEIADVPVLEDYLIGVDYRFTATYGNAMYKALFAKTPIVGEYANIRSAIPNSTALVVDSHLVWMNRARIDYVILTIRSGSTAASSYRSDTSYVNRILSSPYLGNVKIAFAYDFGGLGLGSVVPAPNDSSMIIEYKANALNNYISDYTTHMGAYFDHPAYMKVGNKNLVFLRNAFRLWAKDNPGVTLRVRQAMQAQGRELFLVGEQETWSPPQRYENRFRNAVDAIYHSNFLAIATNDLTRLYQFHQVTDQNWSYSKRMFNGWNVQFVPNIGPSRNSNLSSPNAISPYYNPYFEKDSTFFVKYCNVGKLNADKNRLIIIDAWNVWNTDSQIEPAIQYGDRYLKILLQQFKKK